MAEPSEKVLPDKRYFRIGEVCELTGLKSHVLRYWETEFKDIKPQKTKTNQRLYRKKDVETILLIKRLLYEQRYTIAGARAKLDLEKIDPKPDPGPTQLVMEFRPEARDEIIDFVIDELHRLRRLLDNEPDSS